VLNVAFTSRRHALAVPERGQRSQRQPNILVGGWIGRDIERYRRGIRDFLGQSCGTTSRIVREAIGNALEDTIFDWTTQFWLLLGNRSETMDQIDAHAGSEHAPNQILHVG
jgi:hypothetical protein